MKNRYLQAFIDDVKVESVKFLLQISTPYDEIQHNDIMGNFNFKELDGAALSATLGAELRILNDLSGAHDYGNPFSKLIEEWGERRRMIQAEGYGYGDESNIRRSEAYSYVFLLRILRKRHKKLHKLMKNRLKQD